MIMIIYIHIFCYFSYIGLRINKNYFPPPDIIVSGSNAACRFSYPTVSLHTTFFNILEKITKMIYTLFTHFFRGRFIAFFRGRFIDFFRGRFIAFFRGRFIDFFRGRFIAFFRGRFIDYFRGRVY